MSYIIVYVYLWVVYEAYGGGEVVALNQMILYFLSWADSKYLR